MKIDWNKLNKINVRELTDAQTKHLVVKALIVQRILLKYKKRSKIRTYTEFPVTEGKIADVYFENIETNECYAYEIQHRVTPDWLKETKKVYENWNPYLMKTADWVLVRLEDCPNDIYELKEYLDTIIL